MIMGLADQDPLSQEDCGSANRFMPHSAAITSRSYACHASYLGPNGLCSVTTTLKSSIVPALWHTHAWRWHIYIARADQIRAGNEHSAQLSRWQYARGSLHANAQLRKLSFGAGCIQRLRLKGFRLWGRLPALIALIRLHRGVCPPSIHPLHAPT